MNYETRYNRISFEDRLKYRLQLFCRSQIFLILKDLVPRDYWGRVRAIYRTEDEKETPAMGSSFISSKRERWDYSQNCHQTEQLSFPISVHLTFYNIEKYLVHSNSKSIELQKLMFVAYTFLLSIWRFEWTFFHFYSRSRKFLKIIHSLSNDSTTKIDALLQYLCKMWSQRRMFTKISNSVKIT